MKWFVTYTVCTLLCSFAIQGQKRVNVQRKADQCHKLVDAAVEYIEKNPIHKACKAFVSETRWRRGEIEVFVFSNKGNCLIFGSQRSVIWDNIAVTHKDILDEMISVGKQGGGFVNFLWNNGYMNAFVRLVYKEDELLIVGAGFYPDSGEYITEQLVHSAIEYGKSTSAMTLFEAVSNPHGRFRRGEIFLEAFDFNGICVAHPSVELIGQNLIDNMTEDHQYPNRDIVNIAKSKNAKGWYEYASRHGGARKRVYVERLTTTDGKEYAIVGGYYPAVTEADVRAVVKRAVSFMRTHGAKESFSELSQPNGRFAYGGVTLFVFNMDGTVMADMANPAFVGQNLINSVDQDGQPMVKIILSQANKYLNGWVSFHERNAYSMTYFEKVKLLEGDFVVGVTYFPTGKQVTVRFMVGKAVRHLEQLGAAEAFQDFVAYDTEFIRGDVYIEVLDSDAVTLVAGPYQRHKIWEKDTVTVDDKGKLVSESIVAMAKGGGGWMTYEKNNATRRIYAKQVVKVKNPYKEKYDEFVADTVKSDKAEKIYESFTVVCGYYL